MRSALRKPIIAALVFTGGIALAKEPDLAVTILEPADGAIATRRELTVVASVGSGATKVRAFVIEGKKKKRDKGVALTLRADGHHEARLRVPQRGPFQIEVAAEDDRDIRTATRTLEAKRELKHSELWASGSAVTPVKAKTLAGEEVDLNPEKGVVLVHFYSAWDDCPDELAWLKQLEKKYGAKGLTIVGVASVLPADHDAWTKYLEKNGVTWKNVPDPDGAIAKNWNDCAHEVPGSQTDACMVYVMSKRKIAGGDYISYDYVTKMEQTGCGEALEKLFP